MRWCQFHLIRELLINWYLHVAQNGTQERGYYFYLRSLKIIPTITYFPYLYLLFFGSRQFKSINWSSIEIIIKIDLEKALKLNSVDIFLKKCSFSDLNNVLKYTKKLTSGLKPSWKKFTVMRYWETVRYRGPKFGQNKKNHEGDL